LNTSTVSSDRPEEDQDKGGTRAAVTGARYLLLLFCALSLYLFVFVQFNFFFPNKAACYLVPEWEQVSTQSVCFGAVLLKQDNTAELRLSFALEIGKRKKVNFGEGCKV